MMIKLKNNKIYLKKILGISLVISFMIFPFTKIKVSEKDKNVKELNKIQKQLNSEGVAIKEVSLGGEHSSAIISDVDGGEHLYM